MSTTLLAHHLKMLLRVSVITSRLTCKMLINYPGIKLNGLEMETAGKWRFVGHLSLWSLKMAPDRPNMLSSFQQVVVHKCHNENLTTKEVKWTSNLTVNGKQATHEEQWRLLSFCLGNRWQFTKIEWQNEDYGDKHLKQTHSLTLFTWRFVYFHLHL